MEALLLEIKILDTIRKKMDNLMDTQRTVITFQLIGFATKKTAKKTETRPTAAESLTSREIWNLGKNPALINLLKIRQRT